MSNVFRMLSLTLALTLSIAASGCFRYGVSANVPTDRILREQRGPVFAWGLAGQDKLAPECPAGVASSQSFMPWWGGLVALVTVGIVAPWRVEYVCADSSGSVASTPDADDTL